MLSLKQISRAMFTPRVMKLLRMMPPVLAGAGTGPARVAHRDAAVAVVDLVALDGAGWCCGAR